MKKATEKILTMNDLGQGEIVKHRSEYISQQEPTLRKYFGAIEMHKLKQTFLSRLFWRSSEIKIPKDKLAESNQGFSRNPLLIPKIMNLLVEILLESGIGSDGIFRVNSLPDRLKALNSIADSITSGEISLELGESIIKNTFDIFDISETYKMIFRKCGSPVLPDYFLPMAARVSDIESIEDKRICCRTIMFGLPRQNRMILESCIFLCTRMAVEEGSHNSKKRMNLVGLGVVMTPNLVNFNKDSIDFGQVKKLSDFVCFLFEHYKEIAKIC